MSACFIVVLAVMLIAHVVQVLKHQRSVGEMRQRHILSLHRVDMYQRALTIEPAPTSLTKFINKEVERV